MHTRVQKECQTHAHARAALGLQLAAVGEELQTQQQQNIAALEVCGVSVCVATCCSVFVTQSYFCAGATYTAVPVALERKQQMKILKCWLTNKCTV